MGQIILCCLSFRILPVCWHHVDYLVHAHVCVCMRCSHAGRCVSMSVFVCLVRIDMQTGLISRDLWALTGCRLVSTATSKDWGCFTYPDGELHSHAQFHIANWGSRASRCRELPMWGWEWKRGQHAVSVAGCLWWVHEGTSCLLKLKALKEWDVTCQSFIVVSCFCWIHLSPHKSVTHQLNVSF